MPPDRPSIIDERTEALRARWDIYARQASFDNFLEFAITLNSLAEHLNRLRLPGLARLCEGLETLALSRIGRPATHPLPAPEIALLQQQVETLLATVDGSRLSAPERRTEEPKRVRNIEWIKQRLVWLVVAPEMREMANLLRQQIVFFGFLSEEISWEDSVLEGEAPLAVLFIPGPGTAEVERRRIAEIRERYPASQLIYVNSSSEIKNTVALMRSGVDITLPAEGGTASVITCILDLVQNIETEQYRVLIVGTTRVAVTLIQRTLSEHGIVSHSIRNPESLLDELRSYQPDLILMGMYMPSFNGVEATRVLRQMPAYRSLPIVYLSSESDVGMQVEALRLGGDQFLNTPFNPVLLAAVVKTKIERFREILRSTRHDGLTGLLNHTAAKSVLQAMVAKLKPSSTLSVVMIDIDRFKSINDTYGHPVGDQVIRGLGWLLKGRLRSSDLIGRYGGEEFLVALPEIPPAQALSVIDYVRRDFSSLPHTHPNGIVYATFSAGIASYPEYSSATLLTEAADFALLDAKQNGRNRVMAAQSGDADNPPPVEESVASA